MFVSPLHVTCKKYYDNDHRAQFH